MDKNRLDRLHPIIPKSPSHNAEPPFSVWHSGSPWIKPDSNSLMSCQTTDRQRPAYPCVSFLTPRLYINDLDAICSLQVCKQVPMNNCVVRCPGSDSSPGWLTVMPADAESWLCAATWSNSGDGHGHWSWVIAHARSPEILTRNICIEMSPWSEKKTGVFGRRCLYSPSHRKSLAHVVIIALRCSV